jgi:RNA polymerase sigma-70 factor (ECF subfamily)
MNEAALIVKAQAGDFQAFMELVKAHQPKVFAMIRRLAGNDQDAEDIMQDTLLRAIDKIEQFRGDSAFGTWLYTIGLNQARAQFAKHKKADLKPIEEYLPSSKAGADHNHDGFKLFDWHDPARELESTQLKQILSGAVANLPYKYREAFLLRYIEELSVKEVARLTKQTEASAKSRILRARLALRDSLSEIFEDEYGRQVS